MTRITRANPAVTLGNGITIRAPGIDAEVLPAARGGSARGVTASSAPTPIAAALRAHRATAQPILEVHRTQVLRQRTALRTPYAEPAMEVTVPAQRDGSPQVLLLTDESGVTTWSFADPATKATTRARAMQKFTIRASVPDAGGDTRGFAGMLGKKLLQLVVFPLLKGQLKKAGHHLATEWERKNRPHRLRSFTAKDFKTDGKKLSRPELSAMAGGPALLLIHGTFDRAKSSFGKMEPALVRALHRKYKNRVFAFDHPTLATDPRDNVRWLLEHLPPGIELDLDVICSSRGGLIGRILAERLRDKEFADALGDRSITINRAIWQAVPNNGTALADTQHVGAFIDSYTNLLSLIPDNPATDALETVIAIVRFAAEDLAAGLHGITAMAPSGSFIHWLNESAAPGKPSRSYFALASNYEPQHQGFKRWAQDVLFDGVFKADNDLVVPTNSPWEENHAGAFPIPSRRRVMFGEKAGVTHGGYFEMPQTAALIRRALSL